MKLRFRAGCVRLVAIGLFAGGALAGCSTAAMKTTPLWDSEYETAVGPPEDRINIWPLFYYRNPAYSILWPLISVTPEGHAFVPFYEYAKPNDELRIGTIHQILPALAVFNGEEKYRRVLNFISDGEEKSFMAVPIYFQDFDDDFLLIVPAFAKGEDWFWTPLYTHSKNLKGILGPLFFVHKDGDSRTAFFPFPLFGYFKRGPHTGFMALPLVYHRPREGGRTTNVGVFLFHQKKDGDEMRTNFLWPLGAAGHAEDEKWNRLIPLWYSKTDEKGARFISLPFTRIEGENLKVTNALLNGYVGVEGSENKYESFVFPFFHRFKTQNSKGHAAFPLYALFNNNDGTKTFFSPLVNFRDDGSFVNVGGPAFYYSDREGMKKQAVLWPFSFWWKAGVGSCRSGTEEKTHRATKCSRRSAAVTRAAATRNARACSDPFIISAAILIRSIAPSRGHFFINGRTAADRGNFCCPSTPGAATKMAASFIRCSIPAAIRVRANFSIWGR
jgi:hypothetical protein